MIKLLIDSIQVAVVLVGRFYFELYGFDIIGTVFAAEFTNVFMVVRYEDSLNFDYLFYLRRFVFKEHRIVLITKNGFAN